MTKDELEVKISTLQNLVLQKNEELSQYAEQIKTLDKELKDLNKPKLTPIQFDEVSEAIETAIGNFEFDNEDNYSIDFGLDYDGRVHCESFQFDNAYDLHREIYSAVEDLFAETKDDNQENQD